MSHDWHKALVTPATSIQETIKVIDKEALRIALVVDEQQQLKGVVTDGDIRRALLQHIPLGNAVSEIMNPNPKSVSINDSKARILAAMERDKLLQIPILDGGVLVGLETLQHLLQRTRYDNPVFLMAGGFGTRLKPLTDNCPKPLLKVGGKAILETILESFVEAGFHRFYISTHYMPEMIQSHFGDGSKWNVTIEYVHEEEPLGTGGALGLLPDNIPQLPLIMMNGDVLTKVDFEQLLDYHLKQKSLATMCVQEYSYQVPYGVIQGRGNQILSMEEKPVHKFFVNAGIYVIDPILIQSVPENQRIDMPTLLEQQIAAEKSVTMFPLHEYWLDIGKMPDFEQAQHDFSKDFAR
ncbi:MAG: nucleotidyltransferase family protein [Halopseudomonas sp.]